MSRISEAILNAAVSNIGESQEDAAITKDYIAGRKTGKMLDTVKAKERTEDRWNKEQDRLTAMGLDENSPRWRKAQESFDATNQVWVNHLASFVDNG